MKIRTATLADKDTIFELLIELKRSGYQEMGVSFAGIKVTEKSTTMFEDCLLREDIHIIVAEHAGGVIGVSVAYETPKIIEGRKRLVIEEMVIQPTHRGQGVGSALLRRIETIGRHRNIQHIKIATGVKLRANTFYQQHGYTHFENSYRKDLTSAG